MSTVPPPVLVRIFQTPDVVLALSPMHSPVYVRARMSAPRQGRCLHSVSNEPLANSAPEDRASRTSLAIDSTLPRLKRSLTIGRGPLKSERGIIFENWARTFTCKPELYFRPNTVQDIVEIIAYARQQKRRLTVVGAGHSPGDIACTDDYMISLDNLCSVLHVDKPRHSIRVQAGMRLYQLHQHLEEHGFAMPNLGSISEQSIGGFIATATHGSSLKYSILSQFVRQLTIITADGSVVSCSRESNHDLFKAALVSLGALGIIVDVTLEVGDAFDIKSDQHIVDFSDMLDMWQSDQLWQKAEFVRVWWFPYSRKTVVWNGERVKPGTIPRRTTKTWYRATFWAYHVQQALLSIGRLLPSLGPSIERTVFRNQYGSIPGLIGESVDRSYDALNMNCLFSQYVNEWSIPLEQGIEACRRLDLWLQGREAEAGIPYSSEGVFVHAPIELRVANSDDEDAWLSTAWGGPTCYIGVIMYRPFGLAASYRRYFQAYEFLMKSLGGRPHWAKQHNMQRSELLERYPKLQDWLDVRSRVDPDGMFTTPYHERHLLSENVGKIGNLQGDAGRRFKARL